MKILISHDSGAHLYDRIGFQKVLNYCGHECVIWDLKNKSAHDIFSEFDPDIFLGQLHNIDRSLLKCLLKKPIKVALKAGHWGDVDKDVDQSKYPVLMASDEHKRTAQTLKDNDRLDFVFVHYNSADIDYTMGGWKNIVKPVGIMNGYDWFTYNGGEFRGEWTSELSFLGGNWPYKSETLKKYLYPLCNPVGKFNIKIYGNSPHPVGQYKGYIQEENTKHIFISSTINLDVAEPHAYDFKFDISEKLFKVAGAGGFYLSLGYVKAQQESLFEKNFIPHAENEETIRYWFETTEERENKQEELHKEILKNHTYFERVDRMFEAMELYEDGDKVLVKKKEVINVGN